MQRQNCRACQIDMSEGIGRISIADVIKSRRATIHVIGTSTAENAVIPALCIDIIVVGITKDPIIAPA